MYFMLFLKNLTKNLEKKLVIMFVLMEKSNFTNIFSCACYIFCCWGKHPSHPNTPREEMCWWSTTFIFPQNISEPLYLLKIIIIIFFFSYIFIKQNQAKHKIAIMAENTPLRRFYLSFKIMKNTKIVDPVLIMNSFTAKMMIYKNTVKMPLRK